MHCIMFAMVMSEGHKGAWHKGAWHLAPSLQVRDAVVYLLDAWASVSPPEKLFPAVLEAMTNPKCIIDGKVTGLQW